MPELSKVALFTKEYPPHVYGGAGVHVEYLGQALAKLVAGRGPLLRRPGRAGRQPLRARLPAVGRDASAAPTRASWAPSTPSPARSRWRRTRSTPQVVHCHTWYTDMGGILAGQLWGVPYVLTIHSLEPLRPWKVEQLGNAYHLSAWMERTAIEQADAVIAVSHETREDVLRALQRAARARPRHPQRHRPRRVPAGRRARRRSPATASTRSGPTSSSSAASRARRASSTSSTPSRRSTPSLQVVLCAGAPDTPEIGAEMEEGVAAVSAERPGVIWIREMLPRPEVIQLYGHAAVFCCPSVYEPFGIINLEAMACETAVVASAVGGIKEVVVPGETGLLVDPQLKPGTFEPADPPRLRRRPRGRHQPARPRREPPRAHGQGRAAPRRRALQLGRDRPADGRPLPLAALRPPHAPSVKRLPVVEVTSWSGIRSCAAATKLTPLQCIGMRRSGFSSCRPRTTSAT